MRSLLLVPRLPQVLRPFGLVELVRSGKILMTRGPEAT
jgi:acetolactate synthase small subunit